MTQCVCERHPLGRISFEKPGDKIDSCLGRERLLSSRWRGLYGCVLLTRFAYTDIEEKIGIERMIQSFSYPDVYRFLWVLVERHVLQEHHMLAAVPHMPDTL